MIRQLADLVGCLFHYHPVNQLAITRSTLLNRKEKSDFKLYQSIHLSYMNLTVSTFVVNKQNPPNLL